MEQLNFSIKGFCYVYSLAYPDGRVFYVGKGTQGRINQHEYEAKRGTCRCAKCKIIQGIWGRKGDVIKKIIREGLTSNEALALEGELIRQYQEQLVNVKHGRSARRALLKQVEAREKHEPLRVRGKRKKGNGELNEHPHARALSMIEILRGDLRYARYCQDSELESRILDEIDAYRALMLPPRQERLDFDDE